MRVISRIAVRVLHRRSVDYGLSILVLNKDSQAPFHPTPEGQAAIAALIKQSFPPR